MKKTSLKSQLKFCAVLLFGILAGCLFMGYHEEERIAVCQSYISNQEALIIKGNFSEEDSEIISNYYKTGEQYHREFPDVLAWADDGSEILVHTPTVNTKE